MKKELLLLCGFLGSGKTTVLCRLIEQYRDRRLAVLLNDFGDIPVDGTLIPKGEGFVLEIGGGSIFCSCLKDSFVKALQQIADSDAELVLVEASGMSDPASVDRLLALSGLDATFTHLGTLCLFDPIKSFKLAQVLEVIPRQLRAADTVLLTKADMTTPDERSRALACIQAINPDVPVLECRHGTFDLSALRLRESRPFVFGFNTPENRPDSFLIRATPQVSTLLAVLEKESSVLRVKGYLYDKGRTVYISDTGKGFVVTETDAAPTPLTVICMQGTGDSVQCRLREQGLILNN